MNILVTGAAGFIGFHLVRKLIENGHTVHGLDNINDYYDTSLKYGRLKQLGIEEKDAKQYGKTCSGTKFGPQFKFVRMALEDGESLDALFARERIDTVCNLAAQAGVRYSLENPKAYVDSNLVGFVNLLECCRNHKVKHLVYASSSSVYGLNKEIPFKTSHNVDKPISLYAATKKSNELMAFTYSHLFGFRTTGLRFFTVYGPWGRPDMAMFLFTKAIIKNEPIKVFNMGNMERDFTYIDDIVEGVFRIIEEKTKSPDFHERKHSLYNIGNNKSIKLMKFIETIEKELGIKAKCDFMPIQPGDVEKTWADVDNLMRDFDYRPNTPIETGVANFINWYKEFYQIR